MDVDILAYIVVPLLQKSTWNLINMSKRIISESNAASEKRQRAETGDAVDDVQKAYATLQSVDIKQLMEQKGPTVKNVLLRKDGSCSEVTLDMTPAVKSTQDLLGGDVTFLGQYDDLQVILLINRTQTAIESERNQHKLQPPFHTAEVYGDILLSRSDDDGMPQDFTLEEYVAFTKQVIEPFEVVAVSEDSDSEENDEDDDEEEDSQLDAIDEDDEESDGDDEDDEAIDDEDAEQMMDMLLERLRKGFKEQHGRDPNEEEFADLAEALMSNIEASYGDEGEDEEEEEEEKQVAP